MLNLNINVVKLIKRRVQHASVCKQWYRRNNSAFYIYLVFVLISSNLFESLFLFASFTQINTLEIIISPIQRVRTSLDDLF